MKELALQVRGLGKRYRLGQREPYRTVRESLVRMAGAPLKWLRGNGNGSARPWIWALKDVELEVRAGEAVGIIGRNGAGKSTLLKILSRITEPTEGYAEIAGRVGSLLEVGTGFHKELTGRENIFLNGALLGMRKAEIKRKFDAIVDFAEIETFIDTPVKRYSSGMYMRLAFAVAAHLEPEILLVDEVLAVGDAAFQKKCLGKMDDVTRGGRTVLFVSHNMPAVQALCPRSILLDGGRVAASGLTEQIIPMYTQAVATAAEIPLRDRTDRSGDGSARITSLRIEPASGGEAIHCTSRLRIAMHYEAAAPLVRPSFMVTIFDVDGRGIYYLNSDHVGGISGALPTRGVVSCLTGPINVTPGRCYVTIALRKGGGETADYVSPAGYFDVEGEDFHGTGKLADRGRVVGLIDYQWKLDE